MPDRDEKGRFKPGHTVTRKDSPNRAKKSLEEAVFNLVEGNMALVTKDLKKLKPKDRIRAITDLMKYVLPAKRSVDSNIHIDNLSEEQADRILEEILAKHELNEE